MNYSFSAKAATPGQALSGNIEIRKSRWIIPGSPVTQPLQEHNALSAGYWNTFLSADVIPDVDVVITIERKRTQNFREILLLGFLVIAIAAAVLVVFRA